MRASTMEHLAQPVDALERLHALVRPGGTATVIEGNHGSRCSHPDTIAAHEAIGCQIELQRRAGGNAPMYPLPGRGRKAPVRRAAET